MPKTPKRAEEIMEKKANKRNILILAIILFFCPTLSGCWVIIPIPTHLPIGTTRIKTITFQKTVCPKCKRVTLAPTSAEIMECIYCGNTYETKEAADVYATIVNENKLYSIQNDDEQIKAVEKILEEQE